MTTIVSLLAKVGKKLFERERESLSLSMTKRRITVEELFEDGNKVEVGNVSRF